MFWFSNTFDFTSMHFNHPRKLPSLAKTTAIVNVTKVSHSSSICYLIAGVIVIKNWVRVEDKTPPENITDLVVINAAADGDNVFTIGWTAPGEDLNIGRGETTCYNIFANKFVELNFY